LSVLAAVYSELR